MKELDKTFKQKGFNFVQLKRDGNKALYQKTKKTIPTGKFYEVVLISSHNGYELGGQYIEPAETYPSSSLWGTKGWSFNDIERAELFYKKLKEPKKKTE